VPGADDHVQVSALVRLKPCHTRVTWDPVFLGKAYLLDFSSSLRQPGHDLAARCGTTYGCGGRTCRRGLLTSGAPTFTGAMHVHTRLAQPCLAPAHIVKW
jgi:hypothetical protein